MIKVRNYIKFYAIRLKGCEYMKMLLYFIIRLLKLINNILKLIINQGLKNIYIVFTKPFNMSKIMQSYIIIKVINKSNSSENIMKMA